MSTADAYRRLAHWPPRCRGWLLPYCCAPVTYDDGAQWDIWPLAALVLARLSMARATRRLSDVQDDSQLAEKVQVGVALLELGTITPADMRREARLCRLFMSFAPPLSN